MKYLLVILPSALFFAALWWRTARVKSAHRKIAALEARNVILEARIAALESLVHEPIVRLDMRMKYASTGRA